MNNTASIRLFATTLLIGTLAFTPRAPQLRAQTPESATQTLLDRAHTLELRGRIDIAAQDWQQVLLIDPNNVDALAGLARSSKLSGSPALANVYLARIEAINPQAAQPSHALSQRPRPTTIRPLHAAHHIPEVQPTAQTQSTSKTAPVKTSEPSNLEPTTPTQQPQTNPPTTQPQQEVYGPYVPYVPPAPKITPPQTEVAVIPPLACPIPKPRAPHIIPQHLSPRVARQQQMPGPANFGYGQQYPQPRPTPRIKPVQPPAPPSIAPLVCEPPAPALSVLAPPVS